MTMSYSYENAKQSFDTIFEKADIDGKVEIRKNDRLYILTTVSKKRSPLDVKGFDMNVTREEIVSFIHESRKF
jgi:hypothetical protein